MALLPRDSPDWTPPVVGRRKKMQSALTVMKKSRPRVIRYWRMSLGACVCARVHVRVRLYECARAHIRHRRDRCNRICRIENDGAFKTCPKILIFRNKKFLKFFNLLVLSSNKKKKKRQAISLRLYIFTLNDFNVYLYFRFIKKKKSNIID